MLHLLKNLEYKYIHISLPNKFLAIILLKISVNEKSLPCLREAFCISLNPQYEYLSTDISRSSSLCWYGLVCCFHTLELCKHHLLSHPCSV
jgi:hypothetical protein